MRRLKVEKGGMEERCICAKTGRTGSGCWKRKRRVRELVCGLLAAFLVFAAFLQGFCLMVNAAGKNDLQDYTDTEARFCILAVRADVFEGFAGEVQVVLQDSYGREETCTLTVQNGYAWNLMVAEGSYQTVSVRANQGERRYEVKRLASRLQVSEGEVTVCRLVVTEYEIEEEIEETAEPSAEGETEERMKKQETTGTKTEKGEKKSLFDRRFSLLLWLAALAATAGYWYFHYGRRKYGGR